MGQFDRWLQRRLREDSKRPADKFSFSNDADGVGGDHDQIKGELFRLVFSKYPTETMQFLEGIAQRGDEEVNALIKKLNQGKGPTEFKQPQSFRDKDEVVPPMADTGQGGDFEGE